MRNWGLTPSACRWLRSGNPLQKNMHLRTGKISPSRTERPLGGGSFDHSERRTECSRLVERSLPARETRPEEVTMRNTSKLGLALLVTGFAGALAPMAQDNSGKAATCPRQDGHLHGREEDGEPLSPPGDLAHPPRRQARPQRVRVPEGRPGAVHRLRALLRRRLHAGVPGPRSTRTRARRSWSLGAAASTRTS